LNKKLGGHTGDTYGATVEFAEAAGILAASIMQCAVF
jgi:cobalamin synthase